jgi:type VI secretion system secreted protein Hcp
MAQVECFLKIDGVEGESSDDRHRGEIEVESFSWGETHVGGAAHGGGTGAGKVQPQDLQIVKKLDKSSPLLMSACATGQHFRSATLVARKAGAGQQDYLKVTLEDVTIGSYQIGSSQGGLVPMDQVGFTFATLEMIYREQKRDGTLGDEIRRKFDFVANRNV